VLALPAATALTPHGVSSIVRNFSDPSVGCVSSIDRCIDDSGAVSGEGAYVRYEMFIRQLETRVGTLVGLSGSVDEFGHVTAANSVVVVDIPLDGDNDGGATPDQIASLSLSQQVFAVVSGIPEAADNNIYGPYSLLINGTTERSDGGGLLDDYPW
jgi:hypothetical protein